MGGTLLHSVQEEKDLGIWITSDLKVSRQCSQAYCRANRMLGLINRTIMNKSVYIMLRLYKSLVRPLVEYCTVAWSPGYKKDRTVIERIQRRFTKMIPAMKNMNYEERLRRLGLWSLEERRNRADLIQVYRMVNGLSAPRFEEFFCLAGDGRTRGHSMKLVRNRSRLDLRQHFFSERVVSRWNNLQDDVVTAASLNIFKNRMDAMRLRKMDLFRD